MENDNYRESISIQRIETLADGIFAIAMTLLVLGLDLPQQAKEFTDLQIYQFLRGEFQDFFNYALSFFLLASLWILHHRQFNFIRKTDAVHLWINIVVLMFIALVPFSTSLVGDFYHNGAAEFFFAFNMFCVGALFRWNWTYATKNHRLVRHGLSKRYIEQGYRKSLVFPIVSFMAMVMALTYPKLASYMFLLIPGFLLLPYFRK